jgi:hypothetical protein
MSGLSCAGWRDGRGRRCAAGVIRRSPLKAPLLQGQARQDVHGALDRGRRYLSQDVKTLAWPTARLAELRTHARNGVAFDVTTGLPAPEVRQARAKADELSWYEHALNYVTRRCKDWRETPYARSRTPWPPALRSCSCPASNAPATGRSGTPRRSGSPALGGGPLLAAGGPGWPGLPVTIRNDFADPCSALDSDVR